MGIEIDEIIFNEEPDEFTRKRIEKEIKRLWKKNNMTEKMAIAHSKLLCFGEAKVEFEGEEITMYVAPNAADLVFGKKGKE